MAASEAGPNWAFNRNPSLHSLPSARSFSSLLQYGPSSQVEPHATPGRQILLPIDDQDVCVCFKGTIQHVWGTYVLMVNTLAGGQHHRARVPHTQAASHAMSWAFDNFMLPGISRTIVLCSICTPHVVVQGGVSTLHNR